ncbi:MAG: type II toxin-antitoxin system mRNA interferase toxin, RelE/StbE family [Candidatus Pacebacteria bacterium]|nr:type II toxin-antitoxin system mRNA interferase toxin, RelE/StbE family [Candidatus Paceibacterota bacterium]
MIEVGYKPAFIRQYKKLPKALQDEVVDKIELFKNLKNHQTLRVHKLKGELAGYLSFSVNYKYRIVFTWEKVNSSAALLAVGDHSLYD